jgi:alpha-galactosidase
MPPKDRAAFVQTADLAFYCGGWQSWSAGWELGGRETLPRKVRLIPELIKLTNREGDCPQKGWLAGHFSMYIRRGNTYLCIASKSQESLPPAGPLPPVSFRINRKERLILAEVFCPGKTWAAGETLGELYIFFAQGYFAFKDAIGTIYQQEGAFNAIGFLRGDPKVRNKAGLPGGYASWYNHYTDINEKLILEDLHSLGKTENLIKLWYLDRKKPVVFQIDDGWEQAVGEWEIHRERFPQGLRVIAERIEQAGYIPGLWLAPFLVTRRAKIFTETPQWLLRDRAGNPVVAGFNHLWDKQYYCLDLSRQDVLAYLKSLIDRAIDAWGFRYLKLDFLYTGLFYGAFAEGGSPYEHYDQACTLLTGRTKTAAGLPVAYLGCGIPFGPSYRHFPLSRIGADTREAWDWQVPKLLGHVGRPSAYINLLDTIGRSFMDGTVYCNDPDVIFLRSKNCKLAEHEKELIALVNFLLAGQIMFSDDPLYLEAADMRLTRHIVGLYDALADDEYGAARIDRDVFFLESRSGKTAGLINLRNRPYRLVSAQALDLYPRFTGGTFLLDHRLRVTPGEIIFAPHSISIVTRS